MAKKVKKIIKKKVIRKKSKSALAGPGIKKKKILKKVNKVNVDNDEDEDDSEGANSKKNKLRLSNKIKQQQKLSKDKLDKAKLKANEEKLRKVMEIREKNTEERIIVPNNDLLGIPKYLSTKYFMIESLLRINSFIQRNIMRGFALITLYLAWTSGTLNSVDKKRQSLSKQINELRAVKESGMKVNEEEYDRFLKKFGLDVDKATKRKIMLSDGDIMEHIGNYSLFLPNIQSNLEQIIRGDDNLIKLDKANDQFVPSDEDKSNMDIYTYILANHTPGYACSSVAINSDVTREYLESVGMDIETLEEMEKIQLEKKEMQDLQDEIKQNRKSGSSGGGGSGRKLTQQERLDRIAKIPGSKTETAQTQDQIQMRKQARDMGKKAAQKMGESKDKAAAPAKGGDVSNKDKKDKLQQMRQEQYTQNTQQTIDMLKSL